jgi:diguanylate cyclase (GGDEF)-like protein/PAS domain S-box-containing protein
MIKIGFIDYYLDEWHANNYPAWIREASGGEMVVAYAYGMIKSPISGMTTEQWCEKYGIEKCETIEEVIEKSDVLTVLSPDNCEMHEELCQMPLRSGKPVYVDKTFAPDKATAVRIMELAEKHGTPCYSTSALRFAEEYKAIDCDGILMINSWGPGNFDTYSVHQLEPIVMLMKGKAKRVLCNKGQKWLNMPGMIYRCNPDWSMNYVSEGCQRLTGYNRKLFLQFRHYYFNTVVNEEYREYLQKRREEAIRKKTRFKEEYMITAASGKQKWVYEQAYGVFNTDGELIYIDGAVSDITEMKQKEYEYIKRQYRDPLTGLNNRRFLEAAGRNLDRNGILPVAVVVVKIDGIQMVKETFGHKMSDALLVSLSRMLTDNLKDKDKDVLAIIGEDEFCILMPEAGSGQVSDYIRHVRTQLKKSREEIFSNTNLITVYFGYDIKKQADETIASAIQKARKNMYDPDTDLCVHTFPKVVSRHQTFSFPKDRGFRMVRWCRKVGQRLNLDPADMNRLELLALIQNIGLALVSSYILYKADRLTQTEWEMIKKHPEAGYRIALSSPELSDVAEEVLYHHEWWNGDGYPKGLKGEEIPLLSRIIAVIDAFDAMISDRPYRPALTKEEALEELRKNAGIRFDPRIVKIFFEAIQEESD